MSEKSQLNFKEVSSSFSWLFMEFKYKSLLWTCPHYTGNLIHLHLAKLQLEKAVYAPVLGKMPCDHINKGEIEGYVKIL